SITEEGEHHRFQLRTLSGKPLTAEGIKVSVSSDGYQPADIYHFIERDGYLESASCIKVSNGLSVTLIIGHHDHTHDFDVHFRPGSHLESED
ncbi:hypothetical protein OFC58_30575, partial [Escherichia coli]|nr:hypothetical protein [Escherichia coli]